MSTTTLTTTSVAVYRVSGSSRYLAARDPAYAPSMGGGCAEGRFFGKWGDCPTAQGPFLCFLLRERMILRAIFVR
jgi:hypothetical protein